MSDYMYDDRGPVTCKDCRFWYYETGTDPASGSMFLVRSECRRYPPCLAGDMVAPGWLHTSPDEWCGEFRR